MQMIREQKNYGEQIGKLKQLDAIIEHNKKAKEDGKEEDVISVVSGSWRIGKQDIKVFEEYRDKLREQGCELVCGDNFREHFHPFIDGTIDDEEYSAMFLVSKEQLEASDDYNDEDKKRILEISQKCEGLIKIPLNRTYAELGATGEYKYQSSFSQSWCIPQVAGLLALFKELDKTLTFEEFVGYARETSKTYPHIINPEGIYKEIENRREKIPELTNTTLDATEYQGPNLEDPIKKLKRQEEIVRELTPEKRSEMFKAIETGGQVEFSENGQMKESEKDENQK